MAQKLEFSTICWKNIFLSSLTVMYQIITSSGKLSFLLRQFYSFLGAVALALCRTMVTMATQIPSVLTPLRGEIVSHFAKVVVSADDDSQESKDLVVCVVKGVYPFNSSFYNVHDLSFTSSYHRLAWQL